MITILIIFMSAPSFSPASPNGGVAMHHVEFFSKSACEQARVALATTKENVTKNVSSVCVAKGEDFHRQRFEVK